MSGSGSQRESTRSYTRAIPIEILVPNTRIITVLKGVFGPGDERKRARREARAIPIEELGS